MKLFEKDIMKNDREEAEEEDRQEKKAGPSYLSVMDHSLYDSIRNAVRKTGSDKDTVIYERRLRYLFENYQVGMNWFNYAFELIRDADMQNRPKCFRIFAELSLRAAVTKQNEAVKKMTPHLHFTLKASEDLRLQMDTIVEWVHFSAEDQETSSDYYLSLYGFLEFTLTQETWENRGLILNELCQRGAFLYEAPSAGVPVSILHEEEKTKIRDNSWEQEKEIRSLIFAEPETDPENRARHLHACLESIHDRKEKVLLLTDLLKTTKEMEQRLSESRQGGFDT